jgi:hypothetical protein
MTFVVCALRFIRAQSVLPIPGCVKHAANLLKYHRDIELFRAFHVIHG